MTRPSLRTEIGAGITTFLTMSYIVVANPAILAQAGVPLAGAVTATCLGAALATFAMGYYAKYPFALAPGMGLNAFLVFTVCRGMGYAWEIAMAVVFLEGLLILLLVALGLRQWVMQALPASLKHAIGVGIGIFIAVLGLKMGGLIEGSPETLVRLGDLTAPAARVTLLGLALTAFLLVRRVPGAMLLGIVVAALIAGYGFGLAGVPESVVGSPNFSTVGKFWQGIPEALSLALLPVLFAFAITDFFDTMGTVVAVGAQGGWISRRGELPRLGPVLAVDAGAAALGGALGCSSITTYLESASGVAAGGRGPVTAYTVAALFLVAMFLHPLAAAVPACAVAPALIAVGCLMMGSVTRISWGNVQEGLPAFLAILLTPLTFSISTGVGFGVLALVAVEVFAGRAARIHPVLWATAAIFAVAFSPWIPK